MPHIKYHALRHTCATIANEMGITLFDIASMLGHSSIAITSKIYTHQLDKTNSKAVVAVANEGETDKNRYKDIYGKDFTKLRKKLLGGLKMKN